MALPSVYRSIFTAQEIDYLLASIKTKIDKSIIINDFSGGSTSVASAELAKILHDEFVQISDPNYIQSLILSVPGNNLFTDELKLKLETISSKFIGVYSTDIDRNANVNTSNLVGNELTLILNSGAAGSTGGQFAGSNDVAAWEYWDQTVGAWTPCYFTDLGLFKGNITTTTPVSIVSFDTSNYNTIEVLITCFQSSTKNIHTQKMILTANGVDIFYTTFANLGNNLSLITTSTSMSGTIATLTALGPIGSIISAKKTAQY